MQQPLEWEREFAGTLRNQPSGKNAWKRLQRAGMDDFAKFLLYQLYAFGASVSAYVSRWLGEINSSLEKPRYSGRVARERAGDARAEMFALRAERAAENAACAPWPFQNPQVKTVADATRAYPVFGMVPLDQATAVIGDGRQALERYRGKQLLAILRAGAKARGIHLTLAELSELAYAAQVYAAGGTFTPLDKNTLQRFFTSPDIRRLEQAYQRHFEASEYWDLCHIDEAVREEIAQKP